MVVANGDQLTFYLGFHSLDMPLEYELSMLYIAGHCLIWKKSKEDKLQMKGTLLPSTCVVVVGPGIIHAIKHKLELTVKTTKPCRERGGPWQVLMPQNDTNHCVS